VRLAEPYLEVRTGRRIATQVKPGKLELHRGPKEEEVKFAHFQRVMRDQTSHAGKKSANDLEQL
jgi:hypothetical protein